MRYGAAIISPTIPKIPNNPNFTKKDILSPEINIKQISVSVITIAVPKSGSNIINRKNTPITKKIGSAPFFISFIFF